MVRHVLTYSTTHTVARSIMFQNENILEAGQPMLVLRKTYDGD